ncbi:hypothetical protein FT643_15545 [Ketobacter sp. MCCC 1A13808]|uniref:hypothetical protein n=1 Tax=Ketobacter sp. MCCC 1A13808 TaxID=2602738 RepID=UPI000F1F5ED5|nr:hypothetical protein [Ketobacter sp. MCCC 1A13808]MVF13555.1 hypothetical protein [Ketobacter sp. MCCC 1A13808]RLP53338.1 MAG: hypothetical protein D6160_16180 [Ketobacter sp.]
MNSGPHDELPLGTTAAFFNMHKWLQRGLIVCLSALVLEGAFTFPLLAIWYGWPQLSLQEICTEFERVRFSDESRECIYPYPLFGPSEGAGQKTAQDDWGIQPRPKYKAIEFREFVTRKEERLARQASE